MIPISKYQVDKETKTLVDRVLESGQLSQGPMVEEAERLTAKISNCKYAVAVANGTIALEAMLRTLEPTTIETSPFTFRATIKAIENAGHTVEYDDIDADTLCVSNSHIPVQTDRMYMPVDLYGRHASVKGEWAYRDSAQGLGLDLSESKASAISLYTTKSAGAGEGGMVVTNDKSLAEEIRIMRNQGMGKDAYTYQTERGFNWRWNELAAAVAIPQLENIGLTNAMRKSNVFDYFSAFDCLGIKLPEPDADMTWHQFTMQHEKRDDIVAILRYLGIDARVYYPEVFSKKGECPNADYAAKTVFSIPVHQHLTSDELDYIIKSVIDVVSKVNNG